MEPSPSKFTELRGEPIEVRYAEALRDTYGKPAHAATYIRQRLIVLDIALRRDRCEYARILSHEIFHFVWVRLGNAKRIAWEDLLRTEWRASVGGDAGWSAEWRKNELSNRDVQSRSRHWREYACEAFCDTGALIYTRAHAEVTLPATWLRLRARWFRRNLARVAHI